MDLIKRFFGFILNPSHRRTIGILAVLTIALAIPLTANIAQKQQEIRQHAASLSACESAGGSCPNGSSGPCYQQVSTCLNDSYAQSPDHSPNCSTSPGASCTSPGVPNDPSAPSTHYYQCAESTTLSCAPPTTTATSKPACPGECTGVQTCQQVNGGTVDTSYSCTTGACCIIPGGGTSSGSTPAASPTTAPLSGSATCNASSPGVWQYACNTSDCPAGTHKATRVCSAGGTWTDPTCYVGNSTITGSGCSTRPTGVALTCPNGALPVCSNGANIFKNANGNYWCSSPSNPNQDSGVTPTCPTTTAVCKTDAASAVGCNVGCAVVNGVNMKCHTQNKDANGVCSASCTAGGPWNCVIDSACTNPNGIILSFGIGLDGIGTIGDVRNKTVNVTRSPNHSVRNLNLQLINSSGSVSNFNGNISYAGGTFTANVNLGSVSTGTYTVKIKSDGYLWKTIPEQLTVLSGVNTYTLNGSIISLVTGDINQNNQLDITDYNILLSCSIYSNDNHALCNTNSNYRTLSDLDDDGTIDQIDYNLFLREFSTVQNGD